MRVVLICVVCLLVSSCGYWDLEPALEKLDLPGEQGEPFVTESEAQIFLNDCRAKLKNQEPSLVLKRILVDGPYRWETIPFEIDGKAHKVQLSASLTLDFSEVPLTSRAIARKRIQNIFSCVKNFYSNNNLAIELTLSELLNSSSHRDDSGTVTIRQKGERPNTFNMTNWAFELGVDALSDSVLCTIISHELGHMLGLRDEYSDTLVPHRRIGEPDSLMNSCVTEPGNVRLYLRHLRSILKPACEDPLTTPDERANNGRAKLLLKKALPF